MNRVLMFRAQKDSPDRELQRGSVPPVSSAAPSTFSPTFCRSLPDPWVVLHPPSPTPANASSSIVVSTRFILSLRFVDGDSKRCRSIPHQGRLAEQAFD